MNAGKGFDQARSANQQQGHRRKKMTRRAAIKLTALSALAQGSVILPASLPQITHAQGASASAIIPASGHYHFTLGRFEIIIISDGYLRMPTSMLGSNVEPQKIAEFLAQYHLDPTTNYSHLNHVLIRDGANIVLIDAGDGGRFMPETSGRMMDNFAKAGIDPDQITHIILTHAHPDHIWGVRDDFDEVFLPNARYLMGSAERDYWMGDGLVERVEESEQQIVIGAVNSINTLGDMLETVTDGHEVIPGVRMIDTPGHTPGHMSVMVEDGSTQMLVTGDALHHAWMNFAHPEWTQSADIDPDRTITTRKRLLDQAASERLLVSGYHFPFPGLGHVGKFGERYEFIPEIWRWEEGRA